MINYFDVVAATLESFPRQSVPAADEEKAKAQLTRAAAWNIYQLNPRIGLVRKTSGNEVEGLSVDVIIDGVTGETADIATAIDDPVVKGFRVIKAQWLGRPAAGPPGAVWLTPTDDLAALPGPLGGPDEPEVDEPEPAPGQAAEVDELLARLDGIEQQLIELAERQALDTAAILGRLNAVVDDAERTLARLLPLVGEGGGLAGLLGGLRRREPETPDEGGE